MVYIYIWCIYIYIWCVYIYTDNDTYETRSCSILHALFCDVRCFLREFTGTGRNRLKPPVNFQALQVIPSPDYLPGIKDVNVKSTVDVAFDAIFN